MKLTVTRNEYSSGAEVKLTRDDTTITFDLMRREDALKIIKECQDFVESLVWLFDIEPEGVEQC